jgi:hypothetical protein
MESAAIVKPSVAIVVMLALSGVIHFVAQRDTLRLPFSSPAIGAPIDNHLALALVTSLLSMRFFLTAPTNIAPRPGHYSHLSNVPV